MVRSAVRAIIHTGVATDEFNIGFGIAGLPQLGPGGAGDEHRKVNIEGHKALQRLADREAHGGTFRNAHFEKGLRIDGLKLVGTGRAG